MMAFKKNRKQKEAEFHDRMRNKTKNEQAKENNKKFYSITRKSEEFVLNFILERCSNKRVLDYCCGEGRITIFLARHGAKAVGIDISDVSIKHAKEEAKIEQLKQQASFFVMDAENLDFPDNYFDLIICYGVLHHLNIEKAYPELARVIKPKGIIICDEPLVYNPIFQLYRKMTPHLRTKWELKHILSKKEIELAREYFDSLETKFFHLFTPIAAPFYKMPGFYFILSFLEKIDSLLVKLPVLKWLSWQIVYKLSKPKK